MRIVAIDWSGRSGADQRRAIWLAEAVDGELVRLEDGRTRDEVVDLLIEEAASDPELVVGFDFAFSLPAWYLDERGVTAQTLWAALAGEALTPAMRRLGLARWLTAPEPPFWTTGEAHALLAPDQELRRTERDVRSRDSRPKSVFQLVGAGQVGRGSLYGMRALHRLSAAGFHVWPFDPAGLPLVVEIYPRLLTGPVRKSSGHERERRLAAMRLSAEHRRLADASEDAFDAALSALAMAGAADELAALPAEPEYASEGKIWRPRGASPAVTVSPELSVRRGREAVEFYCAAFGAVEVYRVGGTDEHPPVVAQLSVGASAFWVADEAPQQGNVSPESVGGTTVRLLLVVDDPHAVVERAVGLGARELAPVGHEHGWLLGRIEDPFGHHWEIGKPLGEWPVYR